MVLAKGIFNMFIHSKTLQWSFIANEPMKNHVQIKDEWEKFKKKYIAKKNEKVIKIAPSKCYWFDRIDQILTKVNCLSKGKDMWTYVVKDVDHNTKPKCKDYHH